MKKYGCVSPQKTHVAYTPAPENTPEQNRVRSTDHLLFSSMWDGYLLPTHQQVDREKKREVYSPVGSKFLKSETYKNTTNQLNQRNKYTVI